MGAQPGRPGRVLAIAAWAATVSRHRPSGMPFPGDPHARPCGGRPRRRIRMIWVPWCPPRISRLWRPEERHGVVLEVADVGGVTGTIDGEADRLGADPDPGRDSERAGIEHGHGSAGRSVRERGVHHECGRSGVVERDRARVEVGGVREDAAPAGSLILFTTAASLARTTTSRPEAPSPESSVTYANWPAFVRAATMAGVVR
jgi:hypothetical protein